VNRRALALALGILALPAYAGPDAPPRIVSLAPSLTELAYAAGAGGALVGTVEYSDYPDAARSLPRVGDAWRVDPERVLALRPDLVLAWESGTPAATVSRLESLGLHVVWIPTYRLSDVPAALRTIGRMAGSASSAEVVAARFEYAIGRLRAAHAQVVPVRVFIEIDDEPLYTVNGHHIISEVVDLCGGRNVFAGLPQLAPPVALEAVLERDPQVILTTDDTIADPGALWRRWKDLTAVARGTIYSMPSDTLTRATPRLAEGAGEVCRALDDARTRLAGATSG
jgi:iron complex transport system substrate-binding protein